MDVERAGICPGTWLWSFVLVARDEDVHSREKQGELKKKKEKNLGFDFVQH